MSEKESRNLITHNLILSAGINLEESGLLRFIPENGITPLEFIALPIEAHLEAVRNNFSGEEKIYIITARKIFPGRVYHQLGLFAIGLLGPLLHDRRVRKINPQKIIDAKKKWLQGLAPKDSLKKVAIRSGENFSALVQDLQRGLDYLKQVKDAPANNRKLCLTVVRILEWEGIRKLPVPEREARRMEIRKEYWLTIFEHMSTLIEELEGLKKDGKR